MGQEFGSGAPAVATSHQILPPFGTKVLIEHISDSMSTPEDSELISPEGSRNEHPHVALDDHPTMDGTDEPQPATFLMKDVRSLRDV